jgi:hypothetical protein
MKQRHLPESVLIRRKELIERHRNSGRASEEYDYSKPCPILESYRKGLRAMVNSQVASNLDSDSCDAMGGIKQHLSNSKEQ